MARTTVSRLRASVLAALLASLSLLAPVTSATAAAATTAAPLTAPPLTAPPGDEPVGGPALGRAGILVDRTPGVAALPQVSAAGWLVADAGTGDVLAARNAHGTYLPASTLKTLTAVALLRTLPVNSSFVATRSCVNIEGSKVGLVAGMRYTIDSLFMAMLVVSGNDAATCLAEAAGGMHLAVRAMNAEARRLQANDTLARNTSGLDAPGQVTSAYDLALITRAGLSLPKFAEYNRTLRSSMPAPGGRRFEIYNHNKLLTRYRGTIGGKTGYTVKARRTYVGVASRGGRTLIVTLLKAETSNSDATRLLDWGFAAAGRATPVGRLVDPLPDRPAGTVESPAPEKADRSRDVPAAGERPVAASTSERSRSLPVLPAGVGAGVLLVVGVGLRRRAIRRRRAFGPASQLRLKLPVR